MAFPGFAASPVENAGVPIAVPEFSRSYWVHGVAGPQPDRLVIYDELPCTVRVLPTEGGSAKAKAVVAEDGTAGVQVQITQTGVWDVVLVDSFEDAAGTQVIDDALGDHVRTVFGRGDAGSVLRLNQGSFEMDAALTAFLRPNVIAPSGIGGRCLYQNVYLAIEGASGGLARVTPVIDGERLTDETVTFAIPSDGATRAVHRFEVPLSRRYTSGGVDKSTMGVVGTWFTVEVEVVDTLGTGRVEIAGMSVEFTVMEESLPGQAFTGESRTLALSPSPELWYMGTDGSVLRGQDGYTDNSAEVAVRMRTNELAWAGIGGEALYQNVYLAITRFNATDWTISVTPIVDDQELTPVEFTLAGVSQPVTEVLEMPLAQEHPSGTNWPRGCWLALLLESDTSPDGLVVLEGWSPEAEIVSESLEAADA